jgi:hypothetical protein
MDKICTRCGQAKSDDCFGRDKNRKDGLNSWCRECVKETSKAHYAANTEKRREASLAIYHRNAQDEGFRDSRNARQRVYSKDYMRRPRTRQLARGWMKRYMSKIKNRISKQLSYQVWYSLRLVLDKSRSKNGKHWPELVGWTVEQLMTHLESKFQSGMTWDNYGEWHIDHVTPRSWFPIKVVGDEAFRSCWRLENLQPMWARDNSAKGNRFSG